MIKIMVRKSVKSQLEPPAAGGDGSSGRASGSTVTSSMARRSKVIPPATSQGIIVILLPVRGEGREGKEMLFGDAMGCLVAVPRVATGGKSNRSLVFQSL